MTPAEIADSHLVLEGVDPDLTGKPQRFLIFLRALPRGEGPCRLTWLGESIHERGAEGVRGSAVLTLTAILERVSREAWQKVDLLQRALHQSQVELSQHKQQVAEYMADVDDRNAAIIRQRDAAEAEVARLKDRQQYIEDNAPALVVALEEKVARQTEELRKLNQRCEALMKDREWLSKGATP